MWKYSIPNHAPMPHPSRVATKCLERVTSVHPQHFMNTEDKPRTKRGRAAKRITVTQLEQLLNAGRTSANFTQPQRQDGDLLGHTPVRTQHYCGSWWQSKCETPTGLTGQRCSPLESMPAHQPDDPVRCTGNP